MRPLSTSLLYSLLILSTRFNVRNAVFQKLTLSLSVTAFKVGIIDIKAFVGGPLTP